MPKTLLVIAVLLTLPLAMGCVSQNQSPQPPSAQAAPTSAVPTAALPAMAKMDEAITQQQKAMDDLNLKIANLKKQRDEASANQEQDVVEQMDMELEGLTEGQAHMEEALNTVKAQRAAMRR